MITGVQNSVSVSSDAPANIPHTPSSSQQPTNVNQSAPNPTAGTKKKKKKKTASTQVSAQSTEYPSTVSSSTSPGASAATPLDTATIESWQKRVQSLRSSLNKSQKENQLLSSDLSAALARANDAEHAEGTVNKGLLTARSVIAQRDRAIAELKSTSSNLRADLTQLQEEKKKTDKRLILLKTVSANLQEAREHRDISERKLDEANSEASKLKQKNKSLERDIESLKQQVEAMEMVKQQLARREIEIDELSRAKLRVEEEARRGELRAFGVGAASVFVIGTVARVLRMGRAKDRE